MYVLHICRKNATSVLRVKSLIVIDNLSSLIPLALYVAFSFKYYLYYIKTEIQHYIIILNIVFFFLYKLFLALKIFNRT